MGMTFCNETGFAIVEIKSKKWLNGLTFEDAHDLMKISGRMTYDRRRSMSNPCNREWADGVQWK